MSKLRTHITKGEAVRYISHLDYARAIERAVRRARLPVAYSEGFNPHMKIAFASALAVGITSQAEYLDIELKEEPELTHVQAALAQHLPPGIELKQLKYVRDKSPALMALTQLATYTIVVPICGIPNVDQLMHAVERLNDALVVEYVRQSPKGKKTVDIKEYLPQPVVVECQDGMAVLSLAVSVTATGSIKPGEVLAALVEQFDLPVDAAQALIERTELYTNVLSQKNSLFDAYN